MSAEKSFSKLAELTKGIKFCMCTTIDAQKNLRSRPLTTQESDGGDGLWFFVGASSELAQEIAAEPTVNLSYAEPSHSRYVSVSGSGTLVRDAVKAKELWNPLLKAWFPKGLEDPDLVLLKVDITKAEYWDTPSAKLVQVVAFVKAMLTGQRVEHVGDHGRIQ